MRNYIKAEGIRTRVISVLLLVLLTMCLCVSCGKGGSMDLTVEVSTDGAGSDTPATPEPTPEPEDPMRARVIVIAGQSNAVGATQYSPIRKNHGDDVYKKYRKGYENVKIAFYCEPGGADGANSNTNVKYKSKTELTTDEIFDKVTFGQSWHTTFFGPEVGMADYLGTNYPDTSFYIVKVAKGDVSIPSHWQPGGACYEKLKETLDLCLKALESDGYHPQIMSFCWMQGENDASNDDLTAAYADNLAGVAEQFRKDYAAYAPSKGIPFVDAGISSYWKNYEQINAIKKSFSESSDINYYFDTMAEGLTYDQEPTPVDPYHFDSDSMLKLGSLFAEYTVKAVNP